MTLPSTEIISGILQLGHVFAAILLRKAPFKCKTSGEFTMRGNADDRGGDDNDNDDDNAEHNDDRDDDVRR